MALTLEAACNNKLSAENVSILHTLDRPLIRCTWAHDRRSVSTSQSMDGRTAGVAVWGRYGG